MKQTTLVTHSLYVKLSKNCKDYGDPNITYQLAGCAEQRPLGITMGDACSARTSTAFKPPRFQESAMKLEDSISDFRKILMFATKTTSDCRNPAPLMQTYMIKSVKMTKKSILRDQFSWKVRTFVDVFSQRHHFILLNYPVELLPRKGLNEQTYTSLKLRTKRRLHHRCIGAVAGLSENMDGACAFFMPIPIVLPLPDFDERIIKQP